MHNNHTIIDEATALINSRNLQDEPTKEEQDAQLKRFAEQEARQNEEARQAQEMLDSAKKRRTDT